MLVELRLENYAVIDNLAVEFAAGLNLLTGETGAGKSILIDALALLLGEKASTDVIRSGAEKAIVAAVIEVEGRAEQTIAAILETNGLDAEDSSIILRREIAPGGKGRVFVNNQPATVAVLRQLAPHLATVHAQNESLLSFDAAARLDLLDAFAGTQLESTAAAFSKWKDIAAQIAELQRDEQDRLRLLDVWTFQQKEIAEAKLQPGEDERLETEKRVLANAEKIYNSAMQAFDLLYEGSASTSASLRAAQKHLEELARYEPKFQDALAALETARISVEDVGASLRDYAGGIEASPEHLAEVEDRLALLDRLKRKYGPALNDVIQLGEEVTRKLSAMENKDETLRQLQARLAQAGNEYLDAARAISKKRYESARKLEKLVESEINDLAMRSSFHIEVSGTDEEGQLDRGRLRPGRLPDRHQSRRAAASAGADCLGRRTLPRNAGAQGQHRDRQGSCGAGALARVAAHAGLRRNRHRHRRTRRRSGRQKAQEPGARQPGALRHASPADRHLCRSSLCDRKEDRRRPHSHQRPPHHRRRAHRRSSPHVERRQADRNLPQARRADDQSQRLTKWGMGFHHAETPPTV